MKAVKFTQYGAPEVLQIQEMDKPVPADNQLLVKIHAITVETTDAIFRRGSDIMARMFTGIRKPKFAILGGEYAGIVEAVGKDVTRFKVGDAVIGSSADFGANAEYIAVADDSPLAAKPDDLTFEEAVALHPGALTALPNLRDAANVQPGQTVLINGASGGIGVAAVQLAKHFGAEVTGVSSTANVELVKSLGADHAIDYKQEDFTRNAGAYDVIFDTVGKSSFGQAKGALKPGGIYLTTVVTPGILLRMLITGRLGDKKARIIFAGLRSASEKNADIQFFLDLYKAGELKPVIDRTYTLDQIVEAHRYVDTGHKKGAVVVTVNGAGA